MSNFVSRSPVRLGRERSGLVGSTRGARWRVARSCSLLSPIGRGGEHERCLAPLPGAAKFRLAASRATAQQAGSCRGSGVSSRRRADSGLGITPHLFRPARGVALQEARRETYISRGTGREVRNGGDARGDHGVRARQVEPCGALCGAPSTAPCVGCGCPRSRGFPSRRPSARCPLRVGKGGILGGVRLHYH